MTTPVEFLGLKLAHPVINGSGTFDAIAAVEVFGDAIVADFPFSAYVTKTITVQPRIGNPPPRMKEVAAGMINSIGLPNKGLEAFVAADMPRYAQLPVPIVVSVVGFSNEEFIQLVEAVGALPDLDLIELNVSCPNVKSGCAYGSSTAEITALLTQLKPRSSKPMIVKLTPNTDDVVEVAKAAEAAGADALSLVNTLRATAFDRGGRALGVGSGGLSGPCIKPVALQQVSAVATAVSIPVVGMGGITNGQDAQEFLQAGATLVAVGTENFREPLAGKRISSELAKVF